GDRAPQLQRHIRHFVLNHHRERRLGPRLEYQRLVRHRVTRVLNRLPREVWTGQRRVLGYGHVELADNRKIRRGTLQPPLRANRPVSFPSDNGYTYVGQLDGAPIRERRPHFECLTRHNGSHRWRPGAEWTGCFGRAGW